MFDMGFAELLIVGLVALLVLGPERLPKVARAVGYWGGRARGYMRQITNELEREVRQSEIRETIEKARATMNTKVDLDAATRDADEPPPASPDAAPPPASASPPDRERGA